MSNRTVRVVLEAVVSGYEAAMKRAEGATRSVSDEMKKAGGTPLTADTSSFVSSMTKAKDVAGEMGTEVKKASQSGEWSTITGGAAIAGGAMVGLTALVGKTGIEYNTLQQTSRAAMDTLLGGAEEANAQMDKLDAFAKTSPFSKAVFIEAQQQMIGFGIETEKVLPYLDSVNEAVAAMGGGNQDVAELSFIMSQISAASKITGTDLMQFGQRGVDAAGLIGDSMGLTGAEVRESITAGTLDADAALDALAKGMKTKFDGASANVKETMGGALDRVKAGWRDLTATIMNSAVDAQGGGWLVDLTNKAADFLRMIEKLPTPVLEVGALITGLGGVSLLGLAGIMKITTSVVGFKEALDKLKVDMPKTTDMVGKLGKAAGIAAIAFAAMQIIGNILDKFGAHAVPVEQVAKSLETLAGASEEAKMAGLDRIFADAEDPARELAGGVNNIADAFGQIEARSKFWTTGGLLKFDDIMSGLFGMESNIDKVDTAMANLDSTLVGMDASDAAAYFSQIEENATLAGRSTEELLTDLPQYAGMIRDQLAAINDENFSFIQGPEAVAAIMRGDLPEGLVMTSEGLKTVADAADKGLASIDGLGGVMEEAKTKAVRFSEGLIEIDEAMAGWIGKASDSSRSFIDLSGAWDSMIEKNKEVAQSAADATEDASDSWETYYKKSSDNLQNYLKDLEAQVVAQQEWQTNMSILATRVSDTTLQALLDMGPKGAALVAQLVDGSMDELRRFESLTAASGEVAGNEWGRGLMNTKDTVTRVGSVLGEAAVAEMKKEIAAGERPIQDILASWDLKARVDADTSNAERAVMNFIHRVNSQRATITIVESRIGGGRGIELPAATGGYGGDLARQNGLAGGGRLDVSSGGILRGPGTSTSDDIPAWLSTKEYVVRAAAVEAIGVRDFDHMNRTGTLPNAPSGALTQTATANRQAPGAVTYVTVEGREAHALLIDMTRDSTRNEYQMNGVHRRG